MARDPDEVIALPGDVQADGRAGEGPWCGVLRPWVDARFEPSAGAMALNRLNAIACKRGLVNAAGRPIRFVEPMAGDERSAAAYELQIWQTGQVPTRTVGRGALHDLYNALAWMAYPAVKARLNALQADRLSAAGPAAGSTSGRGRLRDRITLFDENGALFVTDDPDLAAALRSFDWQTLFVRERRAFEQQRVRVCLLGHALFEKLHTPYKSICAHAWGVTLPAQTPLDDIDRWVATRLDAQALESLSPLPLLGVPGWWRGNEDPAFYNDESVFRQGRGR